MTETERLLEALRPFARYGKQMEKAWTCRDDNVFYGVKRGHQITYGDFRRAAALVAQLEREKEHG